MEQAQGAFMMPLNSIVALASNAEALEAMGFAYDPSQHGLDLQTLDEEHPALASQNHMAQMFGSLLLALCNRELLSGLWHSHGFPGLFAGLAAPTSRSGVMARLQDAHRLLSRELPNMTGARFRDMERRCYLNDQFFVQVATARV